MSINSAITFANIKCHDTSEIKIMTALNCINEDKSWTVPEQGRPIPLVSLIARVPPLAVSPCLLLSAPLYKPLQVLRPHELRGTLMVLVCSNCNHENKGWIKKKFRVNVLPTDTFKNFLRKLPGCLYTVYLIKG